jgi:tRNA(fMet)-specific endonuclease VapC
MIILLDTDICIYIIRRKPITVLQRFNSYAVGDIGVSSVTVGELFVGAQKSQQPAQNQRAVEQFLLPLTIAPFDYTAAVAYGQVRATVEQQGTPIGALDMLIAAHAISLGVTIATNNGREFMRVPALTVEDWVNPPVQP